jgi:hypothetical protein
MRLRNGAVGSLWVKTRIPPLRSNVSFRRLRTRRRIGYGPLSVDFVAKVFLHWRSKILLAVDATFV